MTNTTKKEAPPIIMGITDLVVIALSITISDANASSENESQSGISVVLRSLIEANINQIKVTTMSIMPSIGNRFSGVYKKLLAQGIVYSFEKVINV
tara:strand:+ start:1675 stop:1962 length:288 start_codon:yes stop_codon:yes gene_type:complete